MEKIRLHEPLHQQWSQRVDEYVASGVQIGQARISVRKGFDQGLFRDIVNILQML